MTIKKDSSATYDQGTGKYKTVSETQGERTVTASAAEPAGRTQAASETEPERTTTAGDPTSSENRVKTTSEEQGHTGWAAPDHKGDAKAVQRAENKAVSAEKPTKKTARK